MTDPPVKVERSTERFDTPEEIIETGQWYWVTDTQRVWVEGPLPKDAVDGEADGEDSDEEKDEKEVEEDNDSGKECDDDSGEEEGRYVDRNIERLMCVVRIGSNYAKFESPDGWHERILLEDLHRRVRFESDYRKHIEEERVRRTQRVRHLMARVEEITKRLGVSPRLGLPAPAVEGTTALARLSDSPDPKDYKAALVKAKDDDLPKLFKEIERANDSLARWMTADTLALQATAHQLEGCIGELEDRVFNVTLYAGLSEDISQIRKGEPAGFDAKLHLMQRLLYMDEECLLDYRIGGLEFKSIRKFDRWLCRKKNLDRILPFPRCMRAMQVRRETKARVGAYGSALQCLINFRLAEADCLTFLFIRNGDRVYRMNCDLEFGEFIFPDKGEFSSSEPMMVHHRKHEPSSWLTLGDYEQRCAEQEVRERERALWEKAHPFEEWKLKEIERSQHKNPERWPWFHDQYKRSNPYSSDVIDVGAWLPFDKTNLYYDECMKEMTDRVKYYNRVVLIVQGLFDRSGVLHPHPPVKLWTSEGFTAAVELVYDGSYVLYDGAPPSFEEYAARCGETMGPDSVFVGQEDYWERAEGKKETERRQADYRLGDARWHTIERFKPYNNPGPGYLAKAADWKPRARKATFVWKRGRQRYSPWKDDYVRASITVPANELFDVNAYTPGDYLQFFRDPRTRARYMKWAPVLLTAEEYHAGNLKAREPWEGGDA